MTDDGTVEVTVVNADSWLGRPQQLAQLLATVPGGVIPDPAGGRPDPARLAAVCDPRYWSNNIASLTDALLDVGNSGPGPSVGTPGRSAGAVAENPDRLTLTVEEAAATLGISRAFAYEAVRRGEIPSIRIGRRVLVPKAALNRLLSSPATDKPSHDPGS